MRSILTHLSLDSRIVRIIAKAMRYFFHIFDGPKVFPDENGNRLPSPELAVLKAKALAVELRKAGEFCRSNLVFVLDENGNNVFGCRVM